MARRAATSLEPFIPPMRIMLFASALAGSSAASHADCRHDVWESALTAPLEGLSKQQFSTEEDQWVQGTEWEIYSTADKRLHTVIRNDLGDTARRSSRLTVMGDNDYVIATTVHAYTGSLFAGDPELIIQDIEVTTRQFCYADGKLFIPDVLDSSGPYAQAGDEARALMVLDGDVAAFTASLPR